MCWRWGLEEQNFSLHMLDPSYLSHTTVGSSSGALGIPGSVLGEGWLEDSIRDGSQGMNPVRSPSEGAWTEKRARPRREREGVSQGDRGGSEENEGGVRASSFAPSLPPSQKSPCPRYKVIISGSQMPSAWGRLREEVAPGCMVKNREDFIIEKEIKYPKV